MTKIAAIAFSNDVIVCKNRADRVFLIWKIKDENNGKGTLR